MELTLIKSYTNKPWRSPETYELIEYSLRKKWRVKSINTKSPEILFKFINHLKHESGKNVFVFNIAEYLDEENKNGFLPALFEDWDINHLGSSAKAIAIGLDKGMTKKLLIEHQIPTPQYFVAKKGAGDFKYQAKKIGYPLIVKPIREGGHIGIQEDSIVYDYINLEKIIDRIFDSFNQPALIEKYITGKGMREFSVGIIDGKTRLFTPIEIDFDSMDVTNDILSFESAQKDLEKIKLVPDEKTRNAIITLSNRTFEAVGAKDYSRVDLRMNHTGCYVMEINIMPGLGPQSFLPKAAKDILAFEYEQLIQKLAENAMKRKTS